MSDTTLFVVILFAGFLPTYVWRFAAVFMVSRIDPESQLLLWVRSVATALVAALVVRLVLEPPGALAEASLASRLLAMTVAVASFYVLRTNRAAVAVAAGSATIFVLGLLHL